MSSDIYVKARGLGKKYELHDHPLGHLAGTLTGRTASKHLWALKDFNLDAKVGDFIGIVGRNGAGKSTLLEMITGIMAPSAGEVHVKGRVAALLELGAGFNPEFTGRENAILSASVYGLSEEQTARRLPSIEAFAGIGDFIDRPTREYSSGMYARLAFSVAIHVDADILIVDEILGVGDVRFQQRSMKFLREFSKRGIVLFVSHNETAILSLCNQAIWLTDGKTKKRGHPKEIIHAYQKAMSQISDIPSAFQETGELNDETANDETQSNRDKNTPHTPEDNDPKRFSFNDSNELKRPDTILGVFLDSRESENTTYAGGENAVLKISCDKLDTSSSFIAFAVRDKFGQIIFSRDTLGHESKPNSDDATTTTNAQFMFTMPFLPSGNYAIDVAVIDADGEKHECLDLMETAVTFSVQSRHISSGMANVATQETTMLIDGEQAG